MLKQKRLIIALFLAFWLLAPQVSMARGLVPCGGYTASGQREPACTVTDIFVLVAKATNYLIGAAGVYAVFQILNAGFWLIVSMGNEEKITQWKEAMTNAVVGFVVVMIAFVLVNTAVNFLLVSKCKVNLTNPLSYLKQGACTPNNP